MMNQQRIPIRCRLGDAIGGNSATSAKDVLDNHLLCEDFAHRGGNQPRDRVGWAAGGKRYNHSNYPIGIVLRADLRHEEEKETKNDSTKFSHNDSFHWYFLRLSVTEPPQPGGLKL